MRNRSSTSDLEGADDQGDELRQREERQRRQEAEDLKWLMSDKRGRRFVWRQFEIAGVYRSSFTGNSETFFREGMRNVGLKLLAEVHEHCPEAYVSMLKEHKQ